jgi:hypothetical protein
MVDPDLLMRAAVTQALCDARIIVETTDIEDADVDEFIRLLEARGYCVAKIIDRAT